MGRNYACANYARCLTKAAFKRKVDIDCWCCPKRHDYDIRPSQTAISAKRLALALLRSGVEDLLGKSDDNVVAEVLERRKRSAQKWFSQNGEGPFSFAGCCDVLGLPVSATRKRLLKSSKADLKQFCGIFAAA